MRSLASADEIVCGSLRVCNRIHRPLGQELREKMDENNVSPKMSLAPATPLADSQHSTVSITGAQEGSSHHVPDENVAPRKSARKDRRLWVLVAALIGGALVILALWFFLSPPALLVQGEVDATEVKLAPKVVGRVQELYVHKGDAVKKGQVLVKLESLDLQAKLAQAKADLDRTKQELDKVNRGSREEEIRAASNNWAKARSQAEQAERDFNRFKALREQEAVSQQKLEDAERDWKVARDSERALKAVLDQAEAGYREEDKRAAAAQYRAAEEHVAELQALVGELTLVAPINGEVVDRIVEPGELVSPGFPILSLVDLNDVWVTFNLREDLLAKVRMGGIFTARIPALGNKDVKVKVNYISARGDFATWRATRASGDFDLKTFEVRGVPIESLEGLRPGMSALVTKKTPD